MAAVCSGASGVLEHAGGVSATGAGNSQRSSLCFPCEAKDNQFGWFVLFLLANQLPHLMAVVGMNITPQFNCSIYYKFTCICLILLLSSAVALFCCSLVHIVLIGWFSTSLFFRNFQKKLRESLALRAQWLMRATSCCGWRKWTRWYCALTWHGLTLSGLSYSHASQWSRRSCIRYHHMQPD